MLNFYFIPMNSLYLLMPFSVKSMFVFVFEHSKKEILSSLIMLQVFFCIIKVVFPLTVGKC